MSARDAGTELLAPDAWLTQTLGLAAFVLRLPLPAAAVLGAELARAAPGRALYFAKVPVAEGAAVSQLEDAGFHVVDTQLTFERAPQDLPTASPEVRLAAPQDRQAVLDIAGSCFRFSRFHQDPKIGLRAAHEVKRAWAANCLDRKRGEEVLVALADGRVAGFLAVLLASERGETTAIIDLVGVAPHTQRRGLGAALVRSFIARWGSRAARLRVGTQAANSASVRVYESCGFRFSGAAYVLHAHYHGGKPA